MAEVMADEQIGNGGKGMNRVGFITAVCTSPVGGVPKYPQEQVQVGLHGLVGDYHNRELRPSHNKSRLGVLMPNNDRHITMVAEEVYASLNAELGTALKAGDFGENILVKGMDNLGDIPSDARLMIDDGLVVLRVTEQNDPCKNLSPYHRLLVKKVYGRRGLLCAIKFGRSCFLRPGLSIVAAW
ncbi:MAG: MOSC domain-containing protein [bacterium]|nr:MOSC domain-containing protein [bacterium]